MNLEQSGSIQTESNPLSDDFGRVHQIIQDSAVNSNQSTAPWSFLLLLVHFPGWFGQNSPLGNEDHMFAGKFLFQFSDQPSLDLLEGPQLGNWNEDDDSFFTGTNFDFLGGSNVQFSQVTLEVRIHFQIEQSLGNGFFEIIRALAIRLHNFGSSYKGHDCKNKNKFQLMENCQYNPMIRCDSYRK